MELEMLRACLLEKKGATEERPFGPEALVFKVMGKIFALISYALVVRGLKKAVRQELEGL